jgi:saccharopine dehydrogenase-like NADP-dependent oxidoreductase
MEWVETIYVNGVQLEAFTTSGGLGTMCDTYRGRIENLDYKTTRYPGHARLMNFFFSRVADARRSPPRRRDTEERQTTRG